ncbi:hypothetical protein BKA83DRAFT_4489863 [Pisolithus microcarpus]|nr:hypothetical protein BKA83DRAFT_4489863 [Pisolithus microcarpus]
MSPPSKNNFSSFTPCNELEVANLMDAEDDILDGKKKVPDAMTHTFRPGDEVIVRGEKGAMWHGVIEEIRVQHLKTIYKAWVAVRWYYGKWDIADRSIQNDVGKWELVLSDHIDIISPREVISPVDITKFMEGEACGPFIASDDLFTRWSMKTTGREALEVTFNACQVCKKAYNPDRDQQNYCCRCENWFHIKCLEGLPKGNEEVKMMVTESSMESGLFLDSEFVSILCIPISRGKGHGVVGNGTVMMPIWEEFWTSLEQMKQDMGLAWRSHITLDLLKQAGESHVHYLCPICSKDGRGWYL